MLAVLSLLVVIFISILITRIATVALVATGLSREVARFQSRSAFSGVGFTTSESEKVVNHPVRRRILMWLMLLGNAGIVTVVASMVLTFVRFSHLDDTAPFHFILLAVGLILLWMMALNRWMDRQLTRWINWALKRFTRLDVQDYAGLLHVAGQYKVVQLHVKAADWLADSNLDEARLYDEGVLILGVNRANGSYIGAPVGSTQIMAGDTLVLYGRSDALRDLDQRPKGPTGDAAHQQAVTAHQLAVQQEQETLRPPRP